MTDTKKLKNTSSLAQAFLDLDSQFSELTRISARLEEMDLKSDFDFRQAERLIAHFAEAGEEVSSHIIRMSIALNEARELAEAAANAVGKKTEIIQARKCEVQTKMDDFQKLGEKVNHLTLSLTDLTSMPSEAVTDEGRVRISKRLTEVEEQLQPLIDEAQQLKEIAHDSKIKLLEQSADSMRQSLLPVD